jgi:HSP20 family molecular chaperone IbpA
MNSGNLIFNKKKCKACDQNIESKWFYCPYCGKEIRTNKDVFEAIDKEFEQIGKAFGISNIKMKPMGEGVSIIITSGDDMTPKVDIRNTRDHEPRRKQIVEKLTRIPKFTEEPDTKIERLGKKQIIKIKLPGVKEDDIEIKKLENSIEIRAFVGDKCYFKLIPIPSNANVNETFENEMLKIEVSR